MGQGRQEGAATNLLELTITYYNILELTRSDNLEANCKYIRILSLGEAGRLAEGVAARITGRRGAEPVRWHALADSACASAAQPS